MGYRLRTPRFWARGLMALAGLLALSSVGGLSPAQAAPSFDCANASAPVEHLICSDPVLARYDEGLAEAFAAKRKAAPSAQSKALLEEQRQWLKDRLQACAVPATGSAPEAPQSWAMTACLVNQYEQRLAGLGALPAEEPSLVPESLTQAANFVHPSCLLYATGNAGVGDGTVPPPVTLKACNAAYHHVPLQYNGEEGDQLGAEGMSEGFYTWHAYSPIGALPDGRQVVAFYFNGGGTGVFSTMVAYRISSDGLLIAESGGFGGDRCNGGLEGGSVEGEAVIASQSITAADVGELIGLDESISSGLDYCAVCCFGSIHTKATWPEKGEITAALDGFSVVPEVLNDMQDTTSPAQKCLQQAIIELYGKAPSLLSIDQLHALKGPILSCMGQGKGKSLKNG